MGRASDPQPAGNRRVSGGLRIEHVGLPSAARYPGRLGALGECSRPEAVVTGTALDRGQRPTRAWAIPRLHASPPHGTAPLALGAGSTGPRRNRPPPDRKRITFYVDSLPKLLINSEEVEVTSIARNAFRRIQVQTDNVTFRTALQGSVEWDDESLRIRAALHQEG